MMAQSSLTSWVSSTRPRCPELDPACPCSRRRNWSSPRGLPADLLARLQAHHRELLCSPVKTTLRKLVVVERGLLDVADPTQHLTDLLLDWTPPSYPASDESTEGEDDRRRDTDRGHQDRRLLDQAAI